MHLHVPIKYKSYLYTVYKKTIYVIICVIIIIYLMFWKEQLKPVFNLFENVISFHAFHYWRGVGQCHKNVQRLVMFYGVFFPIKSRIHFCIWIWLIIELLIYHIEGNTYFVLFQTENRQWDTRSFFQWIIPSVQFDQNLPWWHNAFSPVRYRPSEVSIKVTIK